MNCAYHAETPNAAFCIRCGRALCSECVRNVRGSIYCETCLGEVLEGKAASAGSASAPPPVTGPGPVGQTAVIGGSSPGAAFALGLIPGVGAIYNAEYFKAAIHILIFGILAGVLDSVGGPGDILFALMTFGFYIYMPFEAYYTAKKRQYRQQGISLETPMDAFHEQLAQVKNKDLWGGVLLIAVGALFLLDNFDILRLDRALQLWPVALIAIGIWLLKRFQGKAA